MHRTTCFMPGILLVALLAACQTSHEVKPIEVKTVHEVKPMHITIDVNIKVDRALDDFFGEIDQAEEEIIKETTDESQTETNTPAE